MTDRPIIFSAPMVRALLVGRKTQTRRMLSRNWPVLGSSWRGKKAPWEGLDFSRAVARDKNTMAIALVGRDEAWPDPHLDVPFLHPGDAAQGAKWEDDEMWYRVRPPFEIGDRLWVKETWACHWSTDDQKPSEICSETWSVRYFADNHIRPAAVDGSVALPEQCRKNRVSIFMPRWASRLTLTVTDVRVQRLQDCSEEDALAEGIYFDKLGYTAGHIGMRGCNQEWSATPEIAYANLWRKINGPGSWEANPWVVAVTFDLRKGNIDG